MSSARVRRRQLDRQDQFVVIPDDAQSVGIEYSGRRPMYPDGLEVHRVGPVELRRKTELTRRTPVCLPVLCQLKPDGCHVTPRRATPAVKHVQGNNAWMSMFPVQAGCTTAFRRPERSDKNRCNREACQSEVNRCVFHVSNTSLEAPGRKVTPGQHRVSRRPWFATMSPETSMNPSRVAAMLAVLTVFLPGAQALGRPGTLATSRRPGCGRHATSRRILSGKSQPGNGYDGLAS